MKQCKWLCQRKVLGNLSEDLYTLGTRAQQRMGLPPIEPEVISSIDNIKYPYDKKMELKNIAHKAIGDGMTEFKELWLKNQAFLDYNGELRIWTDIDKPSMLDISRQPYKAINLSDELLNVRPDLETRVRINEDLPDHVAGSYNISEDMANIHMYTRDQKGVALHEIQHGMQAKDKIQSGGSSSSKSVIQYAEKHGKQPEDIYEGLIGEAYARLAEYGSLDIHPFLAVLQDQRIDLYAKKWANTPQEKVVNLFGNVGKDTQSDIIAKIQSGEISMKDLPEVRRFINTAQAYPNLSNDKELLEKYDFKLRYKYFR